MKKFVVLLTMWLFLLCMCIICYAEETKEKNKKELTPYEQMVKDRDERFALKEQREHELALEEIKAKILAEMLQKTEININVEIDNESNASSLIVAKKKERK